MKKWYILRIESLEYKNIYIQYIVTHVCRDSRMKSNRYSQGEKYRFLFQSKIVSIEFQIKTILFEIRCECEFDLNV